MTFIDMIFTLSILGALYGLAGLAGFQVIPGRYKHHYWTKKYIQCRGTSCILISVPWLVFSTILRLTSLQIGTRLLWILLIVLAMPSFVYNYRINLKYEALLQEELDAQP